MNQDTTNIPGCFLEEIISPTSIYVTHFQETKEELLPGKMEILWRKRLTSASGQCRQKLDNNRRYSVIEFYEKVCDSAGSLFQQ
ncbi:unnamed protein product [Ranitomeya imitator]|uniref:Uncharacterized protein n=1 Tax=Ranitomeya imitator TaxID=111125 RepID=A0ABN9KMU2_9NEOB|nr:unnamed protein product [Ranitomeya imitator]